MTPELKRLTDIVYNYLGINNIEVQYDKHDNKIKPDNLPQEVSDAWDELVAMEDEEEEAGIIS